MTVSAVVVVVTITTVFATSCAQSVRALPATTGGTPPQTVPDYTTTSPLSSISTSMSPPSSGEVHFVTTVNRTPTGPADPSSGWHVDLADDFNAPLGTGPGEDNLWYPSQPWNPAPTTTVNGDNGPETEVYNSSQVRVSGGNLILSAHYHSDVGAATGDGSGRNISNLVQRNYVSGIVSSTTGQTGYKGFNWTPGDGSTWAFEVVAQQPVNTGELFDAWWSTSQGTWTDERDFFEGKSINRYLDTDWIYSTPNTGRFQQDYYSTELGFDPSAAMHRYTYVVYPNQTWSLFIDGRLQTWVGARGLAPANIVQRLPMQLELDYALSATTFTTGSRAFLIDSVAVYQDNAHAGRSTLGGGVAPGTAIGD